MDIMTLEDTESAIQMTDDRNLTSHTYVEAVAQKIFLRLPTYAKLLRRILNAIDP